MGVGKKFGGILAIVSGILILIPVIFYLGVFNISIDTPPLMENLILSIIVIIGGILGFSGRKAGGWLALACGCLWLVGGFLWIFMSIVYLVAISFFYYLIPIEIVYTAIIEITLAITGGIIILASGE